ncbi:DedA family multipass membrane protein/PAP2 superfamily lipid phosphatase [Oleiphilus messinensis]|uniref:DedA family multipass membrane protein/PAP2 superfamily lipid phosphatase n=1 Tax=Oleiphilus messinensis TaxID=141451 RepID=A0A1Y0IC84_9GAMM|nr:bifunctional DedA family/phosphatase PAP2 family protein [Oleiphilus messinensis]ARU58162.1 DedA family multipass membrane protein/PAP2 superfamily lipid phosphatase [Oleiphilus messinensis]
MNDLITTFSHWLELNPHWLAFGIFATAFLESLAIAGILVPGVAMLFAMAGLAGNGALPLSHALGWAFLGAIAGDGLSFWLGTHFQRKVYALWPLTRYPGLVQHGENFFQVHGGKSIVIGRFIGPVRPVIPLVAGVLRMSPTRFLTFNVLSAAGWAPMYILPGYLIGASLKADIVLPDHFIPVLFSAMLILAGLYWLMIHTHSRLQYDSRSYLWFKTQLAQYRQSHKFWQSMLGQRPGQPLTFPLNSLAMLAASCSLFVIIALLVSHTNFFSDANQFFQSFFQTLRHPILDPLMVGITLLGDPTLLYITFSLGVALLVFRGYYAAALHVALAGLLTVALSYGLKAYFAIPRPELVLNPPATFAFPSGHSSGATVYIGLLAAFIGNEFEPGKRRMFYLCAAIPVLLIALSRLYLGVHWFTDILGGILLGLGIVAVTRLSYNRYDHTPLSADVFTWCALFVGLLATGIYLQLAWNDAMQRYAPL